MYKSLFGVVIKRLRLERGWSQEHLAALSGLERTFISMLEREVKQPSLKTVCDLAKAFNLKNYELLHLIEQEIFKVNEMQGHNPDRDEDQRRLDALEAELEKSRIGEIANVIPVVFFARTPMPEYAATFISSNIKQLLGYDREDFMGMNGVWHEHIHPEDEPGVWQRLQDLHVNQILNQEYRFMTASGRWVQIREELRLVVDALGNPREIVGSMTEDIPIEELSII